MIICRVNENHAWILVQNLGGVKQPEGAPRSKTPIYDGYWTGEAWVPQAQKSEALVFTLYESAKTYMQDNRVTMEQTVAMKSEEPVKYQQLHLDKVAHIPKKWSTEAPYDSLLVFLEGAGLRNENSRITLGQLLTEPPENPIVIPYGGQNYHVSKISYPENQQFVRFHLFPA